MASPDTAHIFYSWQSDLARGLTRDVIRAALDEAATRLGADVCDAPRIESDTAGASGTPDIAETIFRRIDNAAVFVADVTFVGKTKPENAPPKHLPNPNVLCELGYAAARLGWDRILLVSNEHFGNVKHLPFDLKTRRFPATFKLSASDGDDEAGVQAQLTEDLRKYLTSCFQSRFQAAEDAISRLDRHAVEMMLANADVDEWRYKGSSGAMAVTTPNDLALITILGQRLATLNPVTSGYRWTYLGRSVIKRLREHAAAKGATGG